MFQALFYSKGFLQTKQITHNLHNYSVETYIVE